MMGTMVKQPSMAAILMVTAAEATKSVGVIFEIGTVFVYNEFSWLETVEIKFRQSS
jgi:hypothetical protein